MIDAATAMAQRFQRGGRLYAFGNGGSSSDAQAVTQLFCLPPYGQPLPAIGLTADVATLTALANDVGFEVVFARPISAFGTPEDIALGPVHQRRVGQRPARTSRRPIGGDC